MDESEIKKIYTFPGMMRNQQLEIEQLIKTHIPGWYLKLCMKYPYFRKAVRLDYEPREDRLVIRIFFFGKYRSSLHVLYPNYFSYPNYLSKKDF